MSNTRLIIVTSFFALACSTTTQAQTSPKIRFDLQIKPILSNHCWSCHGPDEAGRKAGLRLDLPETAFSAAESGAHAIVPGEPDKSELLARIDSHDADLQMPPASTKKPLTSEQKELLRQWISEGAEFSSHWAFTSPVRPSVPDVMNAPWAKNEIDRFILKRLEAEGLTPSAEASPAVWLRRVALDLTGLPPSHEELVEFESRLKTESRDVVYATVVDRLLQSPRYGERMAMQWLDAARYADTNGYNNDETRTMWPWRDWVINAFTSGMPYDQFITEQIAGDLLPDATIGQKVATGFSRNHVLTTEGGIIEEEYRVEYVADRVHTTSTVFLAMSLQCARCHDHKYDPISQREYYEFASFFNNVPDRVVSYNQTRMAEPLLKVPSAEQTKELSQIEARTAEIGKLLNSRVSEVAADVAAWEESLTAEQKQASGLLSLRTHFALDEAEGEIVRDAVTAEKTGKIIGSASRVEGRFGKALKLEGSQYIDAGQVGQFESEDPFSTTAWVQVQSTEAGTVLSKMDDANAFRGYDIIMDGGKVAAHFVHSWPDNAFRVNSKNPVSLNEWHHIAVCYDGSRRASGVKIYVDGVLQELDVTNDGQLSGTISTEKPFHIGRRHASVPFIGLIDEVQIYDTAIAAENVARLARGESLGELAGILSIPDPQRTDDQRNSIHRYFVEQVDPVSKQLRMELSELPKRREEIEKAIPATMVMSEPAEPRPAFILKRGQYDQRGEQVESAFPKALSIDSASAEAASPERKNRLDLARWLTDPKHPLTARVAVNRWWEMLFGTGLVETSDDFGIQGSLPSHPELLDWLATELIHQKWNQKALLRQIVLSATYRQSSSLTSEQLERDPRNVLLARGSRYRLPAETVRDAALFVSGLFSEQIGGPSVKPYQPEGLWEDVSVERRDKYVPDKGAGLYRRSMYTFWKRTCPPPGMATFDAPDREFCLVRRARTNTPLQALVLLNDPTYVEAARKLAERVLLSGSEDSERLHFAVRLVLCRTPDADEQQEFLAILADARREFESAPAMAEELLSIGDSPRESTLNSVELAAWTAAMSVLLNLDEAISRQ